MLSLDRKFFGRILMTFVYALIIWMVKVFGEKSWRTFLIPFFFFLGCYMYNTLNGWIDDRYSDVALDKGRRPR